MHGTHPLYSGIHDSRHAFLERIHVKHIHEHENVNGAWMNATSRPSTNFSNFLLNFPTILCTFLF